eukprot:TRINITY_DN17440_c0_g1_i1.p1 TRINITY_DN17440_c0_g1~~TRINITY_DN17440_c0_g1_i1.p1  ORF type:complete len:430 (-),score=119.03 TRINITY_DN17440_c0_g1_i1:338-1627(-)
MSTPSGSDLLAPAFTCISCRLQFDSIASQKDHYKSEFHRFNLKRKAAGLAPVIEEIFLKRLGEHSTKAAATEQYIASCTLCGKSYNTEKAYTQHIQSNKHKEKAAAILSSGAQLPEPERILKKPDPRKMAPPAPTKPRDEAEAEDASGSRDDDAVSTTTEGRSSQVVGEYSEYEREKLRNAVILSLSDCIFCKHKSADLQSNLHHMTKEHSFFIPDIEYLVDLEGLIGYLGEKISVGNICLYCNGKGRAFHSLEGVRSHMIEKSHCKMIYEEDTIEEYADFYDFSPSYPTDHIPAIEGAEAVDGEDWEDVEEDDEQEDDVEEVIGKWKESVRIADTQELILADGKRLGHRSLAIYYKQKPHVREGRYAAIIKELMAQYEKMGALASYQSWREKKYNEVTYVGRRKDQREMLKLGIKNNNQKHHREQVLY